MAEITGDSGVSYLVPVLGSGIHEVGTATFIVVVVATSFVVMTGQFFQDVFEMRLWVSWCQAEMVFNSGDGFLQCRGTENHVQYLHGDKPHEMRLVRVLTCLLQDLFFRYYRERFVAFADVSVRSLSKDVDPNIWSALLMMDDGDGWTKDDLPESFVTKRVKLSNWLRLALLIVLVLFPLPWVCRNVNRASPSDAMRAIVEKPCAAEAAPPS